MKLLIVVLIILISMIAFFATVENGYCLKCIWKLDCYDDDQICGDYCFCYQPEDALKGRCIPK